MVSGKGISTAIAAVGMIVLLVIGVGAGYYIGSAGVTASTTTVTSTAGGGSATTVTTVTTVTASGGAPSGSTTSSTSISGGSTSTKTSSSSSGGSVSTSNASTSLSNGIPVTMTGINQTLANACKSAGGKATIYSTEDPTSLWQPYSAVGLQQLFPWFNVNFVGLGSADVVNRGTSEFQAGHVAADVFGAPVANINRLVQAGAVQSWNNSEEKTLGYDPSFLDASGNSHPMWQNPILAVYNTNLVKDKTTLPKNWTDYANPSWKGKLAINTPSSLSTSALLFATLEPLMGNASWTTFQKNLAANSPLLTSDAGGAYTDISTGQASIGIALFNDYYTGATKTHTPVALINMTGPIYVSTSVMALAKNAPDPDCGKLLIQYMSGVTGQSELGAGGNVPALNPSVTAPNIYTVLPKGTQFVAGAYNQPSFFSNPTYWANLYKSIYGQ